MQEIFDTINVKVSTLTLYSACYISPILHIRELRLHHFIGVPMNIFANLNEGLQILDVHYKEIYPVPSTYWDDVTVPQSLMNVTFIRADFPSSAMFLFSNKLEVFNHVDPKFINTNDLDHLAKFTKLRQIYIYDSSHTKSLLLCKSLVYYNSDLTIQNRRIILLFTLIASIKRLRSGTNLPIDLVRVLHLALYDDNFKAF